MRDSLSGSVSFFSGEKGTRQRTPRSSWVLEARRDLVEGSQSRWMRQELPVPLPAELSVHGSSAKWRACGAWPGFAWGPWRSRTEAPAYPPPGGVAKASYS